MPSIRPPKTKPKKTTSASATSVSLIAMILAAGLPAASMGQTTGQLAVVEELPTEEPAPLLPEVMAGLARNLAPHVAGYDALKATFDTCAAAAESVASSLVLDNLATEAPAPAAGSDVDLSIAGCLVEYHEGKIALERAIQATALDSEATLLGQVASLRAEEEELRARAASELQEAEAMAVRRDAFLAGFTAEAERLLGLDQSSWTRDDTMAYGAFVREASALEMMEEGARRSSASAERQAEQFAALTLMSEDLGTQIGEWGRDRSISILASTQALDAVEQGASSLALSATTASTVEQVGAIFRILRDASLADPAVPAAIMAGGEAQPMARIDLSTPDLGLLADIYARNGQPLTVGGDAETAMVEGE